MLFLFLLPLASCSREDSPRYGDAGYFEGIIGLKSTPANVVDIRRDAGISSLTVCRISEFDESTTAFFESPPERMFLRPVLSEFENKKILVKWQKTPVAPAYQELLEDLLRLMKSIGLQAAHEADILRLASGPNGYYALSYAAGGGQGRCYNVTVYLLDPGRKRFYYLTDTNRGFRIGVKASAQVKRSSNEGVQDGQSTQP